MRPTNQKAYTANYPVLEKFLLDNECRCMWQQPVGRNPKDPDTYIEGWLPPGGRMFVVLVYADRRGWDVMSSIESNSVESTLQDVRARCFRG